MVDKMPFRWKLPHTNVLFHARLMQVPVDNQHHLHRFWKILQLLTCEKVRRRAHDLVQFVPSPSFSCCTPNQQLGDTQRVRGHASHLGFFGLSVWGKEVLVQELHVVGDVRCAPIAVGHAVPQDVADDVSSEPQIHGVQHVDGHTLQPQPNDKQEQLRLGRQHGQIGLVGVTGRSHPAAAPEFVKRTAAIVAEAAQTQIMRSALFHCGNPKTLT